MNMHNYLIQLVIYLNKPTIISGVFVIGYKSWKLLHRRKETFYLLFPVSSKGSLICIIPDRITHTTAVDAPVMEHWLEQEIAEWVHHEGSIPRPIASWANTITTELHPCSTILSLFSVITMSLYIAIHLCHTFAYLILKELCSGYKTHKW